MLETQREVNEVKSLLVFETDFSCLFTDQHPLIFHRSLPLWVTSPHSRTCFIGGSALLWTRDRPVPLSRAVHYSLWNLILNRGTRRPKGSRFSVASCPDSTSRLPGASLVPSQGRLQPHIDSLSSDILPINSLAA